LGLIGVNVYEEVHIENLRYIPDPGLLSQIIICQVCLLDDGVVGKLEDIIKGAEDEETQEGNEENGQQAASQRGVLGEPSVVELRPILPERDGVQDAAECPPLQLIAGFLHN